MLGPDYDAGPPGPPGDRTPTRRRTPERSFTTDDARTNNYSPYRPPPSHPGSSDGRRPSLSPSTGAGDRSWDQDGERSHSQERNRSRGRNGRAPSGGRQCKKCGEPLTGQFVRALDGTFHLDCFKCRVSLSPSPGARQEASVGELDGLTSTGLRTNRGFQILSG